MTEKLTDVMKLTASLGNLSNGLKLLSGDQKFKNKFHAEMTFVSVYLSLLKYKTENLCSVMCKICSTQ